MKHQLNIILMSLSIVFIFGVLIIDAFNPIVGIKKVDCYDEMNNKILNLTCEENIYQFDTKLLFLIIPLCLIIYLYNFLIWMEFI